ncbi:MAG: YihA family ribosome biogenesis GTP-binding protein [candidate division Zixibacteria bacterium]|nr:YihA family ribosome biogenesis GTP-binding protein [candidate division Zixibacteria bacterium]
MKKAGSPSRSKKKSKIIKTRRTECEFVGSFFDLKALPKDRLPHIAIAGRSNVGKSSLLNKLVGSKKMAKVSSTPGKTRSLNFFKMNQKFYIVDLPGYGYAKVSKKIQKDWGKLLENYLTDSAMLIGLVLLLDCRRDPTEQDRQLTGWLAARGLPVLIVMTKTDKLNKDKINKKSRQLQAEFGLEVMPFSIVSGIGKKELLNSTFSLVSEYLKSE